ncbi:MAG TPA: hypothetical protein VNK96_07405 [Fimbriimonadales bacterium]|nr:hypothetical protein [Fimbriimonadales bacterium]
MALRIILFILVLISCAILFAQDPDQNPLEPTGFPPNPPKDIRLPPPPIEEAGTYELRVIRSETWSLRENEVEGTKVEFEYRGYRVQADVVLGDVDSGVFALRDNVNILTRDYVIRGKGVIVNFRRRTFRFDNGEMDIRKSFLQGMLLSEVYLEAEEVSGGEDMVVARGATFTTCNLDHPHYWFESKKFSTYPEDKIVFEQLKLKVLDKTVFSLPKLVIPIRKGSREFLPQTGFSPAEGYYLKYRYGLPVGRNFAMFRAELTTEQGLGLGGDFNYESSRQKGIVRIFGNFFRPDGTLSYGASAEHSQEWNFGRMNFTHESRQNNYLIGPQNILHNTRLNFNTSPSRRGSTSFNFTRLENLLPGFHSIQNNATITDSTRWGANHATNLSLSYLISDASSFGNVLLKREVLEVRFQDLLDLKTIETELEYYHLVPIGSTTNFFSGIERTPNLIVRTNKSRLFGNNKKIPQFDALVSIGNYFIPQTSDKVTRYTFNIYTRQSAIPKEGIGYEYEASFFQGFYDEDAAQYTPRLNARLAYNDEKRFSLNFRYNYRRQHGFTPIFEDAAGRYETANIDFLAHPLPGFRIGGQTGFDFNRDREGEVAWQPPSLRMEYEPGKWLRFRTIASYDPEDTLWRSVRFDLSASWKDTRLSVASTYDGRFHNWGTTSFFLDGLTLGRLKVSLLFAYNGFLRRFDSRHLSLTYDLHCAEAVLQIIENKTGFNPGRQVVFFIRIKALPFGSLFGLGPFGNSIGVGNGISW